MKTVGLLFNFLVAFEANQGVTIKTIASKEICVLLHIVLMLCLNCVNTCWSYQSCLSQLGSRFIHLRLLFLYAFKGPFNTYLIHFTIIIGNFRSML